MIIGLKSDGTVVSTGKIYYGEDEPLLSINLSDWYDIIFIAAGNFAVGLKLDGTLLAFGNDIKYSPYDYDVTKLGGG